MDRLLTEEEIQEAYRNGLLDTTNKRSHGLHYIAKAQDAKSYKAGYKQGVDDQHKAQQMDIDAIKTEKIDHPCSGEGCLTCRDYQNKQEGIEIGLQAGREIAAREIIEFMEDNFSSYIIHSRLYKYIKSRFLAGEVKG